MNPSVELGLLPGGDFGLELRQARLESRDLVLLGFNGPVLSLDFVEEEDVDELVPHGLRPSVPVAGDEFGIDLRDLLGDEAVLAKPVGIEITPVPEGDWTQSHQTVTLFGDALDLFFEAAGGRGPAELPDGADHDGVTRDGSSVNPGN